MWSNWVGMVSFTKASDWKDFFESVIWKILNQDNSYEFVKGTEDRFTLREKKEVGGQEFGTWGD